ncbi:MAG: histidine kinase [Actinomycetota bacterium]|nr:MAG: histidine kinase [Actinomycetota bacterium]
MAEPGRSTWTPPRAPDAALAPLSDGEPRATADRLQGLIDTIPAVTYVLPPAWMDHPYLFVSPQVEELLGYPQEAWLTDGRLWRRVLHPADLERAVALAEDCERSGAPFELEYRMIGHDGRTVWVLDRARLVGEPGRDALWQGVLVDVTAEKEAEIRLAEREALLSAIFDTEPECVKLVGPDGTLLKMNPAGLAMVEAEHPDQVLGRRIYPLVVEEDRELVQAMTEAAFHGVSVTAQFDIVGLRGTRRRMESRTAPLRDPDGRVIACLAISRDITESARAKEELERTLDDLRRANEARVQALSRLIHAQEAERQRIAEDLHDDPVQRLTALEIRVGTLACTAADEQLREQLGAVERDLADVITRLRSMMFELRPPQLDREGLVPTLTTHLRRLAEETGWAWSVDGDASAPIPADVAATAFRIALEALGNARRHANARTVRVALEVSQGVLRGSVDDDGRGFDPVAAWSRHDGHLGLVSMRERAELAGGELEIRSAPGAGTTVGFTLPLAGP